MKILLAVHQFFPKCYTGTERLTLDLSKQLQRMGHSVKVFTYEIYGTRGYRDLGSCLVGEYEYQGVSVVAIQYKIRPNDINFDIFSPDIEKIADKVISNGEFDIVHVLHPMRVGSVIRAAGQFNIPVILSPTDFWLMCPKYTAVTQKGDLCQSSENGNKCVKECYSDIWTDKIQKRRAESNEVFKAADCIVSATKFLSQILKNDGTNYPIKIIGFGVDYNNLRSNLKKYSDHSQITLGFLSTLQPHKGAQILLQAYNLARLENIKLIIYGDHFGDEDYYTSLTQMVHNVKNVEFRGAYKFEEMPDILNEIDMVILPSLWWENSPLVLLKSLAFGVPAIVSDLAGLTEIVKDGENGFTFEAGNAEALSQILHKIGRNPGLLNEMKTRIRRPPRIEETAFEYEKIYLDLVKNKSKT